MSFEDFEGSRTRGEPVDLYLFQYGPGAGDYYGYTDAEEEITVAGKTYLPKPIDRDAVKASGTLDKQALTIRGARDLTVAELFRVYPPTQIVTLVIKQGHIGDPDNEFLVIWSGRVLSCKFEHSECSLTCEPIATSMKRAGLRRHYQYGCAHALYMGDATGGCRANKAAATVATTVSAIGSATLTLAVGWNGGFPPEKFLGGMVEWLNAGATERRTILKVNAATNVVTLSGMIRGLIVGGAVDAVLGCNHQMDDCKDLHDNINDYGGQPWIPTKSPFGFYNNYY